MSPKVTIVWVRRDLRLEDQPALHAAEMRGGAVIPLFPWDPEAGSPWSPGAASRWWLKGSLQAFDERLRAMGSRLVVRSGKAERVIAEVARETGATAVFYNHRYEPAARSQEERVAEALEGSGVEVRGFHGGVLFAPESVRNKSGGHYKVFTPYYKACLSQGIQDTPLPCPKRLASPPEWPRSEPLAKLLSVSKPPGAAWDEHWRPGEDGAKERLALFLDEIGAGYSADRDRPDVDGTSRLSPHLHFGELSPRQIWHAARTHMALDETPGVTKGLEAFLRQLVWREFSIQLLHHEPHTQEAPLRPEFEDFPWRDDISAFIAWQEGQTGYPYIDAGMRQLNETGWMHNRVRMAVASFLVKDLLIPWATGARYFWERLVDADLANNTMGWQWTSGCGADAAPYFRIFNPVTQGRKFDPDGAYVRRWVPELEDLPNRYLMSPWEASDVELQSAGVTLGETYPKPIVDHGHARDRALAAYERIKR